jgi:chemotaxis protein CheX
MNVEYINPFVTSVISVFHTMLGAELTRGQPFVKTGSQPRHDISGVIGLSGKARGTIVLSLDREAALRTTEVMIHERPLHIDANVIDAVGELANMIAGSAKARLEEFELSVSLPSVIMGKGHCVEFPSNTQPICIPFECEWGAVDVEVGLVELPVASAAGI